MIKVRSVKPFKRRGQIILPGKVFDIDPDALSMLAGYVETVSAKVIPLHADWRPTPRAWLENGELYTTGVFASLTDEIYKLAGDNTELREKLLDQHSESWRNRNEASKKLH